MLAICDEIEAEGFQWKHDSSLTVVALEPGEVSIAASNVSVPSPSIGVIEVPLPYFGAGWLISGTGLVSDDRHEINSEPSSAFPIPFFRSLASAPPTNRPHSCETDIGRALVVPATSACRLLDAFDFGDADALKARGFQVQNMSKLSRLSSTFSDGVAREGYVASHLNRATWRLAVPENCNGLILRKLYDRFHGRQRARVLIDGEFKGYWYEPKEDRVNRWGMSDFGLELSGPSRARTIEITIDPPPGTPLWSVSRVEVYGHFAS